MDKRNNIALKNILLEQMEREDPETYEQITRFKNAFKIDEILFDRYSVSFLLDTFFMFQNGMINVDTIFDEIRYLEGIGSKTQTKPASRFNRYPLKGLWHKHYFDGQIPKLAQNVKNALASYGISYLDDKNFRTKNTGEQTFMKLTGHTPYKA